MRDERRESRAEGERRADQRHGQCDADEHRTNRRDATTAPGLEREVQSRDRRGREVRDSCPRAGSPGLEVTRYVDICVDPAPTEGRATKAPEQRTHHEHARRPGSSTSRLKWIPTTEERSYRSDRRERRERGRPLSPVLSPRDTRLSEPLSASMTIGLRPAPSARRTSCSSRATRELARDELQRNQERAEQHQDAEDAEGQRFGAHTGVHLTLVDRRLVQACR